MVIFVKKLYKKWYFLKFDPNIQQNVPNCTILKKFPNLKK